MNDIAVSFQLNHSRRTAKHFVQHHAYHNSFMTDVQVALIKLTSNGSTNEARDSLSDGDETDGICEPIDAEIIDQKHRRQRH